MILEGKVNRIHASATSVCTKFAGKISQTGHSIQFVAVPRSFHYCGLKRKINLNSATGGKKLHFRYQLISRVYIPKAKTP